ncbi:hypothetical protein TNCV_560371 [Trichonephila clavipes]|nr:hypothetical protein TNCV_560371 [Trichonephila clavipes]
MTSDIRSRHQIVGRPRVIKEKDVRNCPAGQIILEVDSGDVQKLVDSHNQELTIDELIEQQDQGIEESLDPIKSEDRMVVGNLTEGPNLKEKGLQMLENTDFNEERLFSRKQ